MAKKQKVSERAVTVTQILLVGKVRFQGTRKDGKEIVVLENPEVWSRHEIELDEISEKAKSQPEILGFTYQYAVEE